MGDPPCKHWRKRYAELGGDEGTFAYLERIWDMSVRKWALEPGRMYLASPSAKCECNRCLGLSRPKPKKKADPGWEMPKWDGTF